MQNQEGTYNHLAHLSPLSLVLCAKSKAHNIVRSCLSHTCREYKRRRASQASGLLQLFLFLVLLVPARALVAQVCSSKGRDARLTLPPEEFLASACGQ